MGSVFLAHEETLDRKVAIKFVSWWHPGAQARFLTEARAIARLQHANVVAVYRFGQVLGRQYLAYEYVEGESLDRMPRPLDWRRVLQIGLDVARGLAAAHAAGVLHRDIKPGNVLCTPAGVTKLLDFGLAKLGPTETRPEPSDPAGASAQDTPEPSTVIEGASGDRVRVNVVPPFHSVPVSETMPVLAVPARQQPETITGTLMGTPIYIAPELWGGERATPRSDVYSMGLLLYELATGDLPFSGLKGPELANRVTREGVPRLSSVARDMPQALADVIDRCVALDPGDRIQSAAEVVEALEAVDVVFSSFRRLSSVSVAPPDDVALITSSFARATRDTDAFIRSVYDNLFERDPMLRSLFPLEMASQREKLAGMLQLVVHGLRSPDKLLPVLEDLGERHARYGVAPAHFDSLGEALIAALAGVDQGGFTRETEAAWRRAYDAIAGAMQRGLSRAGGSGAELRTT